MNDIFLDLTEPSGKSVFVNIRNIVAFREIPDGTKIELVTGAAIFVEESPNDIYMVIRSFQNEKKGKSK